jgi:transposase
MSRAATPPTPGLDLPEDADELRALVTRMSEEHAQALAERDAAIEHLTEQLRLAIARRFAPSSERVAEAQLGLFNEAEALAEESEPEAAEDEESETVAVSGHRRARGKRAPLPAHLPRVEVLHELPEGERVCPRDGAALERFSEETSEQLDIVPATIRVLRHVRATYRCPCCREHVVTAPMPAQPIPKSQASPGLLAYVATAKYLDAMPLYRQAEAFERIDATLPDGARRRRARGTRRQPAARRAARRRVHPHGRDHRAGARRTRARCAVDVLPLVPGRRRGRAPGGAVRLRPQPLGRGADPPAR